jgi:hypothetical protein
MMSFRRELLLPGAVLALMVCTHRVAVGASGQTCQDVMQPVGGGQSECVSVYRDGKCQCNAATKKTGGTCTDRAR